MEPSMAEQDPQQHPAAQPEVRVSLKPGALLKAARERLGLTVPDIAAQMNLDPRILHILEADQYDRLAGPVYVRGYIRGYARLVNMNPATLIETYNHFAGEVPPLHPASTEPAPQARSGDKPMIVATVVIVVTLAALALTWWHTHSGLAPSPATGSEEAIAALDEQAAEQEGMEAGAAPPPEPGPEAMGMVGSPVESAPAPEAPAGEQALAPAAASPVGAPQAPSSGAQTPGASESPPATVGLLDAPAATPAVVPQFPVLPTPSGPDPTAAQAGGAAPAGELAASAAAQEAGAQGASAEAQATAGELAGAQALTEVEPTAPATAPPPGSGRLELEVGASDVWVEVFDADDKRLFFGLARSSSSVLAEGRVPLRAVIGRTQFVSVRFNGQALDLAPLAVNGVAKFSIGADGIPR